MIKTAMEFERASALPGVSHKVKMGCGNIYITMNYHYDQPIELFMRLGKQGACQLALLQALGRVISIALQSGVKPEKIADTIGGIECVNAMPGDKERDKSCLDALSKILIKGREEYEE